MAILERDQGQPDALITGLEEPQERGNHCLRRPGLGCAAGAKSQEPLASEYHYLKEQLLFTYLHLAGVPRPLTDALLRQHTTTVAYETVEDARSTLPLLAPMSTIAALNAASAPGEEDLVSAAVAALCDTGRQRTLAWPPSP